MERTERCRIVNRIKEYPKPPKPEENIYDSFFYIFREPPKVPEEKTSYDSVLFVTGMCVAVLSGMLAVHFYKNNLNNLLCISTTIKCVAHQLSRCAFNVPCLFSALFSDIKGCIVVSCPAQTKPKLGRSPTCAQTITMPGVSLACQASPSRSLAACQTQNQGVTFSNKPNLCEAGTGPSCISQGSASHPCNRINKTGLNVCTVSKPIATVCNTPYVNPACRPSRSSIFKTTLTSPPKCSSMYTGNTSHGSSSCEGSTYIKESTRRESYQCHSSPCVKSIGTSPCPDSKRGLGDYDRVKGTKTNYECDGYRTISTCITPLPQPQYIDQCESPFLNSTFRTVLNSVAGRDSPVTTLCKKYLGLTSLIPYQKPVSESICQSVYTSRSVASNNISNSYSQQRTYDVKQNFSLISSLSLSSQNNLSSQNKRKRRETSCEYNNKSPYAPYIPTTITMPWNSQSCHDHTRSPSSFSTLHNMHEPMLGSYCSASPKSMVNSSIISSQMFDDKPSTNLGYNNPVYNNSIELRRSHESSIHKTCTSFEAQPKHSPLMYGSSTIPREQRCDQTEPTDHELYQRQNAPNCIIPVSTQHPPSNRREESQTKRPKVPPRTKAANGRPIIPKNNCRTTNSPSGNGHVSQKATQSRAVLAANDHYSQCPKISHHIEEPNDHYSQFPKISHHIEEPKYQYSPKTTQRNATKHRVVKRQRVVRFSDNQKH